MISPDDYSDNLLSSLKRAEITDENGLVLEINKALSVIIKCLASMSGNQGKVMIIGNGGSAAIASHLQNDLCKTGKIRAMVFTETPLLTALSNDISYNAAYSEQVGLWADKEDILIAISSSGNSQNIIDSVITARQNGCRPIITLSGFYPDNHLRGIGDYNIYIPSREYGYVELAHSVVTHYISDQVARH